MNKYDFEVHPMAKLFPMLPAEEYRKLKADIETHGLIEPIMLSKDGTTLLDGRNRLRACKELGISPKTTVLSDGVEADYIWAKNILRRHLTGDQRAAIALKWSDAEKQAAADRQKATQAKPGEKVGTRKVGAKTPAPSKDRHATRKALARKANVSQHKVRQVEAVAKKAPGLLAKIESGEVSVKDAAATVTPPAKVKVTKEPPTQFDVETKVTKVKYDPAEFTPADPLKQVMDKIREAISAPNDQQLARIAEVFTLLLHLFVEKVGVHNYSVQAAWSKGFDKWVEEAKAAKAEVKP